MLCRYKLVLIPGLLISDRKVSPIIIGDTFWVSVSVSAILLTWEYRYGIGDTFRGENRRYRYVRTFRCGAPAPYSFYPYGLLLTRPYRQLKITWLIRAATLSQYPNIHNLFARLNISLPASAAVERLFSLGGRVFTLPAALKTRQRTLWNAGFLACI